MIFTIAIPTFNNADIIEKALKSCLNQEHEHEYEVLVVDNCSKDGTDKILDSYGDKISRVRNDKTVTQFENHNICIENAKGDYIIFCHSDDELLDDTLSKFYKILKERGFPSKYVVWGRSSFRDFFINWENGGLQLEQRVEGIEAINGFKVGGLTPSGTCYGKKEFKKLNGFIITNHTMAPSDLISMWYLALNSFDFEMVDDNLFKREFATTAVFFDITKKYDSILDAVLCFKSVINESGQKLIIEKVFNFGKKINPLLIKALIDQKMISKKQAYIKIVTFLIRNPTLIFKKPFLFLLFS